MPAGTDVSVLPKRKHTTYIKIDVKTAPTCFGAVTPSGSTLFVLTKLTVVKIVH